VYQIKPAFQEFTEKFPNVILYEKFSETLRYTFHSFRESAVFSGSLEVVDLRFVPRKILRLINVEWKTNPNYLSGNFYLCHLLKNEPVYTIDDLKRRVTMCVEARGYHF
jgi:hypothetical protein